MRYAFDEFVVDTGTRQLLRKGGEVHLSPKAFDLLHFLIECRPEARSKDELMELLWPETFVTEGNLTVLASEIRHALGDAATAPRFVRTVPRYGYAFVAEISERAVRRAAPSSLQPSHWIVWAHQKFELAEGDTVIGRDPHCDVHIDVDGVSRRHACFRVRGDEVELEDLGSKNGTKCQQEAVVHRVILRDQDRIELGAVTLVYRFWPGPGTTVSLVNGVTD